VTFNGQRPASRRACGRGSKGSPLVSSEGGYGQPQDHRAAAAHESSIGHSESSALGALALIMVGIVQLPTGILSAGVLSDPAQNLEFAFGANSFALRLGMTLAEVSLPFFHPGAHRSVRVPVADQGGAARICRPGRDRRRPMNYPRNTWV
jgi:hypothetical protein